jgi:hypothetical protein
VAARGATAVAGIAGQHLDDNEGLPCADFALLVPLKRSGEYGMIRRRVADPKPVDAWQLHGVHYFVFGLRGEPGAAGAEEPLALFAIRHGEPAPSCAVIVTAGPNGDAASVVDLRQSDLAYTVHLSGDADGADPP